MTDRIYPSEFYGDNVRWFIGVVEDVNDPLRLGRVRVRIRGIHTSNQDDIQTTDLPWAQAVVPTTEGGVSGIGRAPAMQPGAEVFGLFLDGQASQLPLVLGSILRVESGTAVQQAGDGAADRLNRSQEPSSTPPGAGTTGARNSIEPSDQATLGSEGNTNAERAFNFFVAYGFTPQQAAGIVGNLMQESGPSLDTGIESAGTERSFGIAQWNAGAGRFQQLEEFAGDLGRDWRELDVQLRFIIWELETYPYLGIAQLRAARTIEAAVAAFEEKFERPSEPNRSARIAYAEDIYQRMTS